ncbi:hypothetical protein F7725_027112, partial [Dissostichus mawsoni]
MELEETPKPPPLPRADVPQAWQQEGPPGGVLRPAGSKEAERREEKPAEPSVMEEPLFLKLLSPAHRRTALLSAQSSLDDSSSSLNSRSRSVSPLRAGQHRDLLIGLSTGMFDANNPKMLRTCSLPDLSRVFSPRQESAGANDANNTNDANAAPDNPLEIEDLEEAAKDEEQSETEDAYEDEDLRDIRASMELLLQEEEGKGDFNGNPPEELFRISAEIQQHSRMAVDDEEEEDEEDEEEEEEEEEEEDDDEEARGALTNGAEENVSNSELNEDGEEGVCEASHSDSIFSRLEELRFRLEQQMGFEKFIEAYNKIKVGTTTTTTTTYYTHQPSAIHEDEDENMALGSSLVFSTLGTEHQHLYPNILHLVMADGAYQE